MQRAWYRNPQFYQILLLLASLLLQSKASRSDCDIQTVSVQGPISSKKPSVTRGHFLNRSKLKCSICGKEFENLGDMQRHTTVEHIQKGELPPGSKDA